MVSINISLQELTTLVTDILTAHNTSSENASLVAQALVAA